MLKRVITIALVVVFCLGLLAAVGCDSAKKTPKDTAVSPEDVKANMAAGGMTGAGKGPAGTTSPPAGDPEPTE